MFARKWLGLGLGVFLVLSLSLFPLSVFADTYERFGPQPQDDDKYLYFGSADTPKTVRNGLSLVVDATSISYQSVKASLSVDYELIQNRNIAGFLITANGVVVDKVEAYFDNSLDDPTYSEVYYLDLDISNAYIGSDVYFQAVGIQQVSSSTQYVVAWSQETPTYRFKPFPVIDREAIGVLEGILQKLDQLQKSLENKMDRMTKAVEAIYTPSPETHAEFNRSLDQLMDKMPMKDLADQVSEINDTLERSKDQLTSTESSDLKFGGKFRLIPELAESEVSFLDLSEYRDQVILFRTVLEAMLWIYFFHMIMNRFTPRLQT